MCPIGLFNPLEGDLFSYTLSSKITRLGCDTTDTLIKLKGGKKKRYLYNNGISYKVRNKSHKTRPTKANLSRRFLKNKFFKKKRYTKNDIQRSRQKKSSRY